MPTNNPVQYDVIIVGAGLAGLAAAKALGENGINYMIIEASSRAGGKVISRERPDHSRFFELGPQFVNEDMTEIVELIQESGMDLRETDITSDSVEIDGSNKKTVELAFIDQILNEENIPFHEKDERLSDLYEKTIKDEQLKKIVSSYHSELFNLHPKNLSSKAVLISSRGYKSNKSELTHQASGPLNRIISYLEKISSSRIVVNEPIRQVIETENGYTLRSDTNKYTSRAVIMAIPPTVASRLTFSEGLKGHFHQAFNSYTDGATIKITWVYPKAFWHEYLLEGVTKRVKGVIFTDPMGITVVDSSKIHEESRLTMFIGADTAKQLAKENKERRIAFAIKLLENVFGEEAHHYSDMEESVWVDDPYCGGGYSAKIHYTGLYDAADLLRKPYQKVIFASSEISQAFPHFMEGAVRSGQYAARCILEKLNKPTSPEPQ